MNKWNLRLQRIRQSTLLLKFRENAEENVVKASIFYLVLFFFIFSFFFFVANIACLCGWLFPQRSDLGSKVNYFSFVMTVLRMLAC